MHLYTCKTLKRIKELQNTTFDCCGEMFDIYNENGKVDLWKLEQILLQIQAVVRL